MKIRVQSIHFDADVKLVDFVKKKADKLDQYFDAIIDGDVFLRLDNASDTANKIVEFKVNVPGKEFFVKEQCQTFEEAADLAAEAIIKQLKKHKELQRDHK